MIRIGMSVIMASTLATTAAQAALAPCYEWITEEKIRGGYLSAEDLSGDVALARDAGLNALMPKFHRLQCPATEENVEHLRAWGQAAGELGLKLLPVFNLRGSDNEDFPSDRREMTIAGDRMERTPCPLDEEFWAEHIVGRALFLAENADELGVAGAIIDPEMYGADHTIFGAACYCDDCMREFLIAAGLAVPDPLPEPAARAEWLEANALAAAHQQHFMDRVQELSGRVESECHAANPDFLLGVLLLDYPLPFLKAIAMGIGTPTYPVLGFSENTYMTGCDEYVPAQIEKYAAMPAHVLFVPGLWQQQFPVENLAEQYYACAVAASGYWIYTLESMLEDVSELPGYQLRDPEEEYWGAIRLANTELDTLVASGGTYESALKVRPFVAPLPVMPTDDIAIEPLVVAPDDQPLSMGEITGPRLRYRNPLFVAAKAGEAVTIRITNQQLANYRSGTQWVLLGPDGARLQEGLIDLRGSETVEFTPEQDGTCVLVASSGQNSHGLKVLSGQPSAFRATEEQRLLVNGGFGRMYFWVPPDVAEFTLVAKAEGQTAGRGGKLTFFGPDGAEMAHLEGDLGTATEVVVQAPAESRGRVWCLSVDDVTNDLEVRFSANMSGYLSADPAGVVVPAN